MAVKMRLIRKGSKHRPFYHLVAIDSRKKRKFLELIGIFGLGQLRVNQEAAERWLAVGAQTSVKVRRLIRRAAAAALGEGTATATPAAAAVTAGAPAP